MTRFFLKPQKKKGDASEKEEGSPCMTYESLSESSHSQDGASTGHQKKQQQKEEECLRKLNETCRLENIPASDNSIFRFACYYNFNYELARAAISEKFDDPNLHLRMEGDLRQQFENLVIYPLPGLMTKNKKHEVLYFHACKHIPAEMSSEMLIQNVLYVFNEMSMTEEQCRNGVAMIVDLNGWTFKNFTNECTNKFLKAVQHQVPTKLESVYIVNAPRWFGKVWKMMKKMIPKSFAKRFVIVKKPEQLQEHLMAGYESYLPFEVGYWRSTEIVEDFVDMKVHAESSQATPMLAS
ncbi:MAG: hypothetical protein SGBAC_013024 [Bacillariaceae sp.]